MSRCEKCQRLTRATRTAGELLCPACRGEAEKRRRAACYRCGRQSDGHVTRVNGGGEVPVCSGCLHRSDA